MPRGSLSVLVAEAATVAQGEPPAVAFAVGGAYYGEIAARGLRIV